MIFISSTTFFLTFTKVSVVLAYKDCKTVEALFMEVGHTAITEDKQKPNFDRKNMYSNIKLKYKRICHFFLSLNPLVHIFPTCSKYHYEKNLPFNLTFEFKQILEIFEYKVKIIKYFTVKML